MTTIRRPLLRLALPALLALATACGGSDDDSGSPAAAGPARTITISNFEFAPETLEVKVGDTITVENKDQVEHTVTATDKSFDTGSFAAGTKTFTVIKAGRFEYLCEIHPFMSRRVVVVG